MSLEDQTLIKSTIRKVLESRKEEYLLHTRTQREACLLAWGADKKIMIGKKSTSVMEINMRNRVIAL